MSSEFAKVMSDHGPRPSLGTHQRAMLAGELYVAFVPELHAVRAYAQRLQAEFNATSGDQLARRRALLRALVSSENITAEKEDEEPWVEPPFRCDYVGALSIDLRA
jgi:maltose O-acetyltransferase